MKIEQCDEFFYKVENKINLFKTFNTSKENVLRNNNQLDFYSGEWVKIKVNEFETYTVKPMETVESVSKKFNINCDKLMKDNGLNSKKLFIGQSLKIYK